MIEPDVSRTAGTGGSAGDGRFRVAVLISGAGSNLQALIQAQRDPDYGVRLVVVGSDRASAAGLKLAEQAAIPTFVESVKAHPDRDAWDRAVTAQLVAHQPDLVVSAGFLKLVGPAFLAEFSGRYLNTHNALLPSFPGMHGPADALNYGVRIAGATLFFVDEGIDTGPILAQVSVPVEDDDDVDTLTERIKVAERRQLVDQVGRLAREGWTIQGRKVSIP